MKRAFCCTIYWGKSTSKLHLAWIIQTKVLSNQNKPFAHFQKLKHACSDIFPGWKFSHSQKSSRPGNNFCIWYVRVFIHLTLPVDSHLIMLNASCRIHYFCASLYLARQPSYMLARVEGLHTSPQWLELSCSRQLICFATNESLFTQWCCWLKHIILIQVSSTISLMS